MINQVPLLRPSPEYPHSATMWHHEANVLRGNAISTQVSGAFYYGTFFSQNTPAQFDAFSQGFLLAAGKYNFKGGYYGYTDRGIVDWYLDGSLMITYDFYSASDSPTIIFSNPNRPVTVTFDGWHELIGRVDRKNASSSNYAVHLNAYWFEESL